MTKLDELNRLIDENNKSIKRLAKIVVTPVYENKERRLKMAKTLIEQSKETTRELIDLLKEHGVFALDADSCLVIDNFKLYPQYGERIIVNKIEEVE